MCGSPCIHALARRHNARIIMPTLSDLALAKLSKDEIADVMRLFDKLHEARLFRERLFQTDSQAHALVPYDFVAIFMAPKCNGMSAFVIHTGSDLKHRGKYRGHVHGTWRETNG